MTTWFTADTHFGHANIIKHCARPFRHAGEMDACMVERWSTWVEPEDDVYHLGDFIWHQGTKRTKAMLDRLPGRKYLVLGNHDKKLARKAPTAAWFGLEWIKDYHEVELDGIQVVLSHYPLEEWNGDLDGSFHLHGHSHGTRSSRGMRRMDVGVDVWGFMPVSWQRVKRTLERRPLPEPPRTPYGPRP